MYCNVTFPYKYRDIVSKLSKREDIVILKQEKGRGVVIMDKHKYTGMYLVCTKLATNCLSVFDHFEGLALKGLPSNPTKTLESKV